MSRLRPNTTVEDVWAHAIIGRRDYEGPVYSLEVDGDGTYVADGMVTRGSKP